MSDSVKQKDINQAVWEACDTFRGVVDPSIYKDYVLTMLFLKYLAFSEVPGLFEAPGIF